jgi:regulator of sirC expression with transglutaminase-like and TPR domain
MQEPSLSPIEALLGHNDSTVHLDLAVLELASVEYPELDPQLFLDILDSHARELRELTTGLDSGPERVQMANEYLFEELGFQGNETDYYSPANSCLNMVLSNRTGIPVSLSVVYIEIARRLGWPVEGVSLPGHFIIQYDDGKFRCYIDPYHGGRIMDLEDCRRLAFQVSQVDIATQPEVMEPATNWQITLRMLHNLRGIYARRNEYKKLAHVLDWILIAVPDSKPDRELREQIRQYMRLLN